MPTSFSFFRLSPSPPYTATRLGMKFSSVVSTVSRSFLQKEARNEKTAPHLNTHHCSPLMAWSRWYHAQAGTPRTSDSVGLVPFKPRARAGDEGQGEQGNHLRK